MKKFPVALVVWISLLCAWAQGAENKPVIKSVALGGGVYTLAHTMAVSTALVGDEGVLLIDSGESPEAAEQLQATLATLTAQPVRWLVNTHGHFDHVNGNAFFGGRGAMIIGQDQMWQRAGSQKGMRGDAPLAGAALPVVTFAQELTLHVAGEEVVLRHPQAACAHTDGDVVVYFHKANVVATGDLYFEGLYPYIDVAAGGSIDGMVAGCREVLARIDDQTKVVPGHGPVADKRKLAAYVAMLADISARVTPLVQAGKTLAEVQAAKPTAAYDEVWGKLWMNGDQFTELVYNGLVKQLRPEAAARP